MITERKTHILYNIRVHISTGLDTALWAPTTDKFRGKSNDVVNKVCGIMS